MEIWKNQLYFGDNLDILRGQHIPAGSVDLIASRACTKRVT
ncbi:MAG: hypothetical protein ACLP2P_02155 [Desulfobaccales bacterium]